MYEAYVKTLADISTQIVEQMTKTEVLFTNVKVDQRNDVHYAVAFKVGYEQLEKCASGSFTLGFTEEEMAVAVACTIAETMGLAPPEKLDDYALDLLNEFINTIFGRSISEWDKMGFSARFSPPQSVLNVKPHAPSEFGCEAYVIILKLKVHHILFRVTFIKGTGNNLRGKRILVVDDSMVIRQLVTAHLKSAGFEVFQAKDGVEAIEKHAQLKPALTIIDQVMPNMNGLDAIVEIQQTNPNAKFIMLTSSSRTDERVTAATLNVVRYLTKPMQVSELMQAVAQAFTPAKTPAKGLRALKEAL